jgi:hypothetical protein
LHRNSDIIVCTSVRDSSRASLSDRSIASRRSTGLALFRLALPQISTRPTSILSQIFTANRLGSICLSRSQHRPQWPGKSLTISPFHPAGRQTLTAVSILGHKARKRDAAGSAISQTACQHREMRTSRSTGSTQPGATTKVSLHTLSRSCASRRSSEWASEKMECNASRRSDRPSVSDAEAASVSSERSATLER